MCIDPESFVLALSIHVFGLVTDKTDCFATMPRNQNKSNIRQYRLFVNVVVVGGGGAVIMIITIILSLF